MTLSLQQVRNQMKFLIQEEKWADVKQLILENGLGESNHVEIINTLANIYVMENEPDKAEAVIVKGLKKYEYNIDLNFNAGVIYEMKKAYKKSLYYFFLAQELMKPSSDEQISAYIEKLMAVLDKRDADESYWAAIYFKEGYYRNFPDTKYYQENWVGEAFDVCNQKYYVGEYAGGGFFQRTEPQGISVEIFQGTENKSFCIETKAKTTIPILSSERTGSFAIAMEYNDEALTLPVQENRYHYYTFPQGTQVKISDSVPFVMAKPIVHTYRQEKPKLVLNIYIDSLSQMFLNEAGFAQAMPFTARFFQKGTICTESYAACEWTYPSVANLFTGKYTLHHRLFHPNYGSHVLHHEKLFPEIFRQNGYFTTILDCNWRSVPLLGYVKGVDRYRYQHAYYGFRTDQVIMETLEQLQAFPNTNQFLSICLFDLHDIIEKPNLTILPQVAMEAKYHKPTQQNVKSVNMSHDQYQVEKYRAQLRKIDALLMALYSYLEENYTEEEMLVSLVSDHGLGFLGDGHYLDTHNVHIPMMFRGKNIPQGKCGEFMSTVDLFPTLCHALGLEIDFLHDGNVPVYFGGEKKRSYAFAESLYPKRPYQAIFYEKEMKIHFTSKGNTTFDGRISGQDGFYGKIFDRKTNQEMTKAHPEKLEDYSKQVFWHIQEYLV